MKTNFNQTGSWRVFLKGAAVVCLSGFPGCLFPYFPRRRTGPAIVKLPAGVTGAEIQRALDMPAGQRRRSGFARRRGLRFASRSF